MTKAIAVLDKVGRSFGAHQVLSNVTCTVSSHEVVGVIGPNGGGKSTLLYLLAGLLRATTGRVTVCGVDAHELSRRAVGTVGLVTAQPGLYPLLTGRENLHHFGGLFGHSPEDIDARAAPLLKALELSRIDARVGTWSTGMQQKLSLVRALLLSPALLLFDEPTANLDPMAATTLYTELRRRADEGLACVVVTHDLASAEAVCDRVLLVDGAIRREVEFTEHRAARAGPLLSAWQQVLR